MASVGRYAPSPTGSLHLGNLRTALAAWAFARSRGGRFLLRIEDLDAPRVVRGAEAGQLGDLRALGIDWDGEPLRQSARHGVYQEALAKLRTDGGAYPCFCSRKDVRIAVSAPHAEDRAAGYPGTCSRLSRQAAQARIDAGDQHCWRLHAAGAGVSFDDGFAESATGGVEVDDFVVCRADGVFAYQLACAVDDALSGVTEVLRGDDLLDSGPRQARLLECLGLAAPRYFHIPLMLGPDGLRLSKRRGSDDLAAHLEAGLDAAAVRSYLAWTLGQCERGERIEPRELAARFDIARVPRSPVQFDRADLLAFR